MKIFYMVTNTGHSLGADKIIHRERRPDDFVVTPELAAKYAADKPDANKRMIPEELLADEIVPDPLTHRLGGTETIVSADKVTVQRMVVEIPAQEQQDTAGRLNARNMLANVRDGVGTNSQRIARMELVLFRLGKDALG